jgi:hypothetical protein
MESITNNMAIVPAGHLNYREVALLWEHTFQTSGDTGHLRNLNYNLHLRSPR